MISKLKRTVALATLLGASAGVAHAEGWYGRFDVGYSFDGGLDIDEVPAGFLGGNNVAFGGDTDHDEGWMGSLGAGYSFYNGFRVEGELAYRENDLDVTDTVETGETAAISLMLNGYYDFNRGGSWQPYVGLGIGGAQVEAEAFAGAPAPPPFDGVGFDDDDTVFAYQAMLGVNFAVGEQWGIDVGYRYFAAPELEYDGAFFDDANVLQTVPIQADYDHHAVTVGLRWMFGVAAAAPPPPPPPAPPPPAPPPSAVCPQSDFVVYFEWDRSNLNQAAMDTIDAAVARARQCNLAGVVIIGHTDTSGSPEYNQALSERRASVVRDALVSRGAPEGAITMQARGETELARQTGDGVREPLNRRTAVTISFR